MSARPAAMANQIAAACMRKCLAIDQTLDATKWLSQPRTVVRGYLLNAIMPTERPTICIETGPWHDQPVGGGWHRTDIRMRFHLVSSGDDLGEKLVNDMASDVVRAFTDDERLGNLVLLAYSEADYTPQQEIMQQTGLAVATLEIAMLYEWAHGAP